VCPNHEAKATGEYPAQELMEYHEIESLLSALETKRVILSPGKWNFGLADVGVVAHIANL
jgi:hypothetical protein